MAGISLEDVSKIKKWLLHVDGSSTIQGSVAGIVITSTQGEDLEFAIKFGFKASNNEAKYKALVIGMKMAHKVGARYLVVYSDSQLIVKEGFSDSPSDILNRRLEDTCDQMARRKTSPMQHMGNNQTQGSSHLFPTARGSSIKNPTNTLYFGVCPNKKGYTSLKKYIVCATEHMQEHGCWLTKLYGQDISGPP
ncbi:UNVERIFIED_CONTAM: hypothetical protein Sradi_2652900 [Sesamum radiatum]|uniref:RNase H type-1 domain-containing protein n=1 Tax=Sesamum radiatum TaxID=300843 RepID=A0AAW2S5B3_SESRA